MRCSKNEAAGATADVQRRMIAKRSMKPDYTACSMWHRSCLLVPVVTVLVLHGGEVTRKPEEYPARMKLGGITIAAENLGPSIPTASGGMNTRDYISIEVAIFAEGLGQQTSISHQQFALRINGVKSLLRPDTPGAVAASIKYPDWEQHPRLEGTAGMGNANVILGRPRPVERFPGDHRPAEGTGTGPMPRIENPIGRKGEPQSVDELVQRVALPEGAVGLPASGCLYFPYKKQMKTIKTLELVYEGPLGEGSMRIP